jgi:SET domain-containing protein
MDEPLNARAGSQGRAAPKLRVRRSPVHGRGVFANRRFAAGETIIEYVGERISWDEALRRHPHDPSQPNHTFYFHVSDALTIDGKVGGNASRWINHSCAPNCETEVRGERVFVVALRDIEPGEELFFDYGLVIDARYTAKLKRDYACRCGSAQCRGTMLAPKRSRPVPGREQR